MKTHVNLWPRICTFENLYLAWLDRKVGCVPANATQEPCQPRSRSRFDRRRKPTKMLHYLVAQAASLWILVAM